MYERNYLNEKILNEYYENNAFKLRRMVDKIMSKKYGGITNKDMDEFYSVANDVFTDIIQKSRYDESKGDFAGFLYKSLELAIIDEFKRQNRDKRRFKIEVEIDGDKKKIPIKDVYIDAPLKEDGNVTVGDMLPSDFNLEEEVFKESDEYQNENIEKYIRTLSETQKQILKMKMDNISVWEIKEKLRLTYSQYEEHCRELKSFAKISILYGSENCENFKEDDEKMKTTAQTIKNCKTERITIASIIKKIEKRTIRFDHPLQRESEQWSPSMKSNLISDILQGNKLHPLIFAEQIINGVPIIWDLDGKQRCTNVYSFSKNGYKISKNIRRWLIKYQTTKKDENGEDILDENGFPIAENNEFDIRGKKFSDLPEELRDRFLDYGFNYDQYLDCSEEDIGYHIERYNDGKQMTASQKGITKLGTEYAGMVKSISNMPFFKDLGGYKVSEFRNGNINRMIIESVISVNCPEKWGKFDNMCKYIKENAENSFFEEFENIVEKLEAVITNETADMFDSKDSFLWFGLFAKFVKMGIADEKFIEFMSEFSRSLHSKKIEGESFDDISEDKKSTKDKGIVEKKMKHLEKLMMDYFNPTVNGNEPLDSDNISADVSESENNIKTNRDNVQASDNTNINITFENALESKIGFSKQEDAVDFNIKTLMISSDYKYNDFEETSKREFIEYFNDLSQNEKDNIAEDAGLYTSCANAYISSSKKENDFADTEALLAFLSAVKKVVQDDISDDVINKWLNDLCIHDICGNIVDKIAYMCDSLEQYQVMFRERKAV